jgi:hypothetical protein
VNERTIWIVRLIGIVVLLALAVLLFSLYGKLVRLQEQRENPAPAKSGSAAIGHEQRSPSPRLAALADPLPRGEG